LSVTTGEAAVTARKKKSGQARRARLARAADAADRANLWPTGVKRRGRARRPDGNSVACALRRLRELSAHAGMVEAGFRKRRGARS
jgi:hypothetical protein